MHEYGGTFRVSKSNIEDAVAVALRVQSINGTLHS